MTNVQNQKVALQLVHTIMFIFHFFTRFDHR